MASYYVLRINNTIVGITFCALLAGIASFSGIADFVELSRHFDLSGGIPSHDTYQRFWSTISPKTFIECVKKICHA
ncbi:MAG: transposase family protein [Holosporales bacterium]|jgi:hypothetical protein|nr:transposase family protein [Holosporales bacterium]